MNKFKKRAVSALVSAVSLFSVPALTVSVMPTVSAESVYKGKIGGNDVWHVTGDYHIPHEMEWIKLENRNVIGGWNFAKVQIAKALLFWQAGKGYLKVIKYPDGKFAYEAVTWI